MSFIFKFKDTISVPILTEWIGPVDFGYFDSATTNDDDRKILLIVSIHFRFQRLLVPTERSVPFSVSMINWTLARGFALSPLGKLCIVTADIRKMTGSVMFGRKLLPYLKNVTSLEIESLGAINFDIIAQLLCQCSELLEIKMNYHNIMLYQSIGLKCSNLVILNLSDALAVTDDAVNIVLRRCKRIEDLRVSRCDLLTDNFLNCVIVFGRNVVKLAMDECHSISSTGFLTFCLHHSRKLSSFSYNNMNDLKLSCFLNYLGGEQLHKLDISYSEDLVRDSISSVSVLCPKLTDLDISSVNNVLQEPISILMNNSSCLEVFKVKNNEQISNDMLLSVSKCPLREIYLQGNALSVQAIVNCASTLNKLGIVQMLSLNDAALLTIMTACIHITELDISNSKVTDAAFVDKGPLYSKLVKFEATECNITHITVSILASNCEKLKEFNIYGCRKVYSEGVIDLIGNCSLLESLNVSYCGFLENKVLDAIPARSRIRRLYIRSCQRLRGITLMALIRRVRRLKYISTDIILQGAMGRGRDIHEYFEITPEIHNIIFC